MHGDADLATPARLMGEPARAVMLVALLDGRSLPASELAAIAGVKPPTASAHLAQLVEGGLVVDRRLGRHRYFALAGPGVADAVEALQRIAPRRPVSSYRQSTTSARPCAGASTGRSADRTWRGAWVRTCSTCSAGSTTDGSPRTPPRARVP